MKFKSQTLHCSSTWSIYDVSFLFYFMVMQENNMNEIKRFNKERRQDLVEMLKGFVSDQVEALNSCDKLVYVLGCCSVCSTSLVL